MISATRRWLRRNRTGIAIGAGVVGVTYLAGQYVLGKYNDARERMQLDRIAKENIRRRFEQNQTDCTITVLALLPTLTENVLEALPVEQLTHELQQKKLERLARAGGEGLSEASSLRDGETASMSSFQMESFMHTSQVDESGQHRPRRSKAQLWNELKVTSITRAFTLIYTLSLLTLLTRIQLNLLGRLNYLSSVVSLAQPPPPGQANSISLEDNDDFMAANFGNDFETNRRFLTFSWYLLHRGYAQIMQKVRLAVEEVFGGISPSESLSAQRFRELCIEVRKRVEGATEQERHTTRWLPFMLPPRQDEESLLIESGVITPPSSSPSPDQPSDSVPRTSYVDTSSGPLRQLLDESSDIIDSPTFTRILTQLLNTMFSTLIDQKIVQSSYPQTVPQSPSSSSVSSAFQPLKSRVQELDSAVTIVPAEPRVKLANILAILTRQAHIIGNGNNPPNEYISAVNAEVKELESFAAVIYTSNIEAGLEQSRPKVASHTSKSASAPEGEDIGEENMGEMLESKFEGAWQKVSSSVFSSRS